MTAYEIFFRLRDEEAHEIFECLARGQKPAYRRSVQMVASRRKLRAVVLEKKTRLERHAWMRGVLAARGNDDLAREVLQAWLLGSHKAMVVGFLEACKIKHIDALIEKIPPQPDGDELSAALDALAGSADPLAAKVYLHVFQPEGDEAWPGLDRILASDSRFQFAGSGCSLPTSS